MLTAQDIKNLQSKIGTTSPSIKNTSSDIKMNSDQLGKWVDSISPTKPDPTTKYKDLSGYSPDAQKSITDGLKSGTVRFEPSQTGGEYIGAGPQGFGKPNVPSSQPIPSINDIEDASKSIIGDPLGDSIKQIGRGISQASNVKNILSPEGLYDTTKGASNIVAGAYNTLFSPFSAIMNGLSKIPAGSNKNIGDFLNEHIVKPAADFVSQSPQIQKFATAHPDAEEMINNAITIATPFILNQLSKSHAPQETAKGIDASKMTPEEVAKSLSENPDQVTLYRGQAKGNTGDGHFSTNPDWAKQFGGADGETVQGTLPPKSNVHLITEADMQNAYNSGITTEKAFYQSMFDKGYDALIGTDARNSSVPDIIVNPKHTGNFTVPAPIPQVTENNVTSNIQKSVDAGEIPRDQVFSKGDILKPEVAQGRISDISQVLNKQTPGLGDKFSSMVDPSNTTFDQLRTAVSQVTSAPKAPTSIGDTLMTFLKEPIKSTKGAFEEAGDIVGKGISTVADSFKGPEKAPVEPPTNFPKLTKVQSDALDQLEQKYYDWGGATKAGVKNIVKGETKTAALDAAGTTGSTPQRVLAEARIIPNVDGTKFSTAEQANSLREQMAPLNEANAKALQEVRMATEPIKLATLQSQALSQADNLKLPAGDIKSLKNDITSEFDALKEKYGDSIPITDLNKEKVNYWGGTKFDSTRPFKSQGNYIIGNTAKVAIEKTAADAGFTDVAQLNRTIGDTLDAAKYLDSLNGNTIKGGRLSKYVLTTIGSTMGTSVPGKLIGALGGNLVAELLMKNDVSNPIKRIILNSIQDSDPQVYRDTLNWLDEQGQLRNLRLALPAASDVQSVINQGRPIPVGEANSTKEYIGPDVTVGNYAPPKKP